MDRGYWKTTFVSCLFVLVVRRAWSTELLPPKGIEVKSTELVWEPSKAQNVTYTVEYSTVPVQEWHHACGCNQSWFKFRGEDIYGKIFRVRAETAGQTTDWEQSERIQCKHTDRCAPQINLTKSSMVLWMSDQDDSLREVHGRHISYRALYWKEDSADDKQELVPNGKTLRLQGLEAGQKYCFQVVYKLYTTSYGSPSRVLCEVVPESPTVRIVVSAVLVISGVVFVGCCLYFVNKNYKRIKVFLHPPLEVPEHFRKFCSGEFPQPELVCVSSQELESSDLITVVSEELGEEEEGRSDGRENSIGPDATA
ncbi:hypothetical protein NFI96_029700 [Prochilodus magdalenae]|nr:hypothetical protein NFI96_029700 [Prochilodus magdalenae]